MKPRQPALDAQQLVQLVEKAKTLDVSRALAGEVLSLKCPCGAVILQPTPAMANLKDRQRGMLKSKIERHLRDDHRLSGHTISVILKESFPPG
jgi:hypothetical protein